MEMKKVLLFTGKFPAIGEDSDGGSILINTLIETLKSRTCLDVAFTRTRRSDVEEIDGVNKVFFETYKVRNDNKFIRRLLNKNQLFNFISKKIDYYDMVIITHCSKVFGIEKLTFEQRQKIVLFPMFLSVSYRRSGEFPPDEYIEAEKKALNAVGKIMTPSDSEKQDLIDFFGVDEQKITVVPRGFSSDITANPKPLISPINLLYIGSIKEQKNTMEAIVLLNKLCQNGVDAMLYIAGGCQDKSVYEDCLRYIELCRLWDRVKFCGVLNQKEMAELIHKMHINISVSNWETYGRGIFEGMAGALPTVVYDRLECVKQYVSDGEGIRFVNTHKDFLLELIKLCTDEKYYKEQAAKATVSVEYLSDKRERERLIKELL